MSGIQSWMLPPLTQPLEIVLSELQGVIKGGLEDQKGSDDEQVKGLKFISNKLIKLFERNRRLKYSNISKILIDNFSSESNDSRNIKRRVYDAINVMVAAGLFSKNGDNLEKKESKTYRDKVQGLKGELQNDFTQKQTAVNNKKMLANRLHKRKHKIEEILQRNKEQKNPDPTKIIMDPIVVNLKDGTKRVQLKRESGEGLCKMQMGKSSKSRHKTAAGTLILKDDQYLQYL